MSCIEKTVKALEERARSSILTCPAAPCCDSNEGYLRYGLCVSRGLFSNWLTDDQPSNMAQHYQHGGVP